MKIKRATFINDSMNLNNQFSWIKPEEQVRLMYLYNSHFSGSSTWSFVSVPFQQLVNSWNVNIKVLYDLPYGSHNYLVEELTGGRHARQMIYKRFVRFVSSVANNRRPALVSLMNVVKSSCLSMTGSNLRKILQDTNVRIEPGISKGNLLNNYRVYKTPTNQEWRIGLLQSLVSLKDQSWMLEFDEETEQFGNDELNEMLNNVCTSQ